MSIKTIFIIPFLLLTLSANERIVSLSPSITEIIYALDKGKSLVGTSSYSLYPNEAKELPRIGDYSNPNLEKIISLLPTLVIGQEFNDSTIKKLQHFKIKTLKLNLKTLSSIKSSINILEKEISSSQAEKLIKSIDEAMINAPKNKNPHSVLIVYGLYEDLRNGIYIAGHDIFFEDIIKGCGNTNAYTSSLTAQPVLNYENVIALNPQQIIILHSHATEGNVDVKKALQAWYKLPTDASKNRRISIVDEDYLHIPSHRVALTTSRLCKEMND